VEVIVSLATIADVPCLAVLWKAMVEDHRGLVGDRWPVREADDAWERRRRHYETYLNEGTGFVLIARDSQSRRPVGYAACELPPPGPTFDLGDVRGEVDSLVTAEDARGQGVGSALLDACREELKRRGARYWSIGVVEANTQAIKLYERFGFRPFVRTMLAPLD
jgi:ribosomal protein S18 acetylase RimI-like enzyme